MVHCLGLFFAADDGSGLACCGVVVGIIVFIAWAYSRENTKKLEAIRDAGNAYYSALEQLKHDSTNANLRQHVLGLGRRYSNLTRDKKGVTIYDEMALMNDINAACAGTMPMGGFGQPVTQPVTNKSSAEERLSKLSMLKEKGLIDDQEYAERRQKILDEL